MHPISVVARAELPVSAGLSALTIPWRTQRLGAIVAAAHGMARAAATHEAEFLAAGLPAGFIEKLVAATEALKDAMNARGRSGALVARATAGLRKEGRVARKTLRILDALVRSTVEADEVLLDEWESISRVAATSTAAKGLGDGAEPATAVPAPTAPESGGRGAEVLAAA
jgi:hypothetical protein